MAQAFKNYRVFFFGSSEFSLPILSRLHQDKWNIAAVITLPDRPKGRSLKLTPTPVKVLAKKLGLLVRDWASLKADGVFEELKVLSGDFAVVAAYGQLIPEQILSVTRKDFLNVHPSLLPKYRGSSPIQYALLNGEKTTGISIIILDLKMDHGPVLAQKEVAIEPEDNYQTLHDRLARVSADILSDCLTPWISGTKIPRSQDDRRATYTKLLTREDGRVNWKKTSEEITRQIRAFTPWPGTWSMLGTERVKFFKACPAEYSAVMPPGQIQTKNSQLLVGCGNNTALLIEQLQPEGRKVMGASAFLKGRPRLVGLKFG